MKEKRTTIRRSLPSRLINDEGVKKELIVLKADLNRFGDRGPKKRISDALKLKIVSSLTKNALSMRQIEKELKDMGYHIEYFKKFDMPSVRPIQAVAYSLVTLNCKHAVSFLESSSQLMISFDGSTKMNKGIQAVVVINEQSQCLCLEAFETDDGTAENLGHRFGQSFVNLALSGVKEGFIEESVINWSKNQISKVGMVMSDSCPNARKTKRILAEQIKELAEDESKVIFVGDCSMHLISNAEKKLVKAVSPPTLKVLKVINEVLASEKGTVKCQ